MIESLLAEEVLTKQEVYFRSIGMTKSDTYVQNYVPGAALGATFLAMSIGVIIGTDCRALVQQTKRHMVRNVRRWCRHRHR